MSIYSPYFYIIKHLPTGILYIGQKYGKDAYPEEFMLEHGYQTSSPKIHELIEKDGLSSFEITRLKLFNTPQAAYNYESRFLKRIKPNTNTKVFNTHSNDILAFGTIEFENAMIKTHGVTSYTLHPDFQKKKTESNQRRYGVDHAIQNKTIQQRAWDTNMKRRGVMYPMQDPRVMEKQKQTCLEKYGVTNPGQSPDAKMKRRKTSLEKYGTESHISSKEVRNKQEQTIKDRYGDHISNPFQLPETIETIRKIKQDYNRLRSEDEEWAQMIQYVKTLSQDIINQHFRGWAICKKETLQKKIQNYSNGEVTISSSKKIVHWYNDGKVAKRYAVGDVPVGFKKGRKI